MAVLSGPTFAREVAAGPADGHHGRIHARALRAGARRSRISDERFRAYTSADIIGVEIGGAVKNVLAVGTGIADGLGLGANTRVALITRGLAEMTRLGVALGAQRETFMGLAGLGDLVLTCTDDQSRNRRFGLALAARVARSTRRRREIGRSSKACTARGPCAKSRSALAVEMPICEQVYQRHPRRPAPAQAVHALMTRALKAE